MSDAQVCAAVERKSRGKLELVEIEGVLWQRGPDGLWYQLW